jgi:hypothetical protein
MPGAVPKVIQNIFVKEAAKATALVSGVLASVMIMSFIWPCS